MNKRLIVGLGNPGEKYLYTRHNVGFLIADVLVSHFCCRYGADLYSSRVADCIAEGLNVAVIKPQTFMNRSGEAVLAFVEHLKLQPADVLVVHDDIDLVPGKVKFSSGGGDGGHRGIRSVVDFLSRADFCRLKIGVGRPQPTEQGPVQPVDQYVLSDFNADELEILQKRIELIQEGVTLFLRNGIEGAMNAVNGR